jgi:hypothetical protein
MHGRNTVYQIFCHALQCNLSDHVLSREELSRAGRS